MKPSKQFEVGGTEEERDIACVEKDRVLVPLLESLVVANHKKFSALIMPCVHGWELRYLLGKKVLRRNICLIERDKKIHKLQANPGPKNSNLRGTSGTKTPCSIFNAVKFYESEGRKFHLVYLDLLGQPNNSTTAALNLLLDCKMLHDGGTVILNSGPRTGEKISAYNKKSRIAGESNSLCTLRRAYEGPWGYTLLEKSDSSYQSGKQTFYTASVRLQAPNGAAKFASTVQFKASLNMVPLSYPGEQRRVNAPQSETLAAGTPKFEKREFQDYLVKKATRLFKGQRLVTLVAACGSGKTVMAARIAAINAKRHDNRKILFICPSASTLGDESQGIIHKFLAAYKHYSGSGSGELKVSPADNLLHPKADIAFITPHTIHSITKTSPRSLSNFMNGCHLIIVDEAHKAPEAEGEDLVMLHKVEKYTKAAMAKGVNALAMTATFERGDGKPVLGKVTPDLSFCLQESISANCCPDLYSATISIGSQPTMVAARESSNPKESASDRATRWQEVADNILEVRSWNTFKKSAIAVFVSRQKDAEELACTFNERSGLGTKGLRVIIGTTPDDERAQVLEDLRNGRAYGYITIAVGEEAIDVPNIDIVHHVRSSKSLIRLTQSSGRCQRKFPGKDRVLLVDHNASANLRRVYPSLIGVQDLVASDLFKTYGVADQKAEEEEEGAPGRIKFRKITKLQENPELQPAKPMVVANTSGTTHLRAIVQSRVNAIVKILLDGALPTGLLKDYWLDTQAGCHYHADVDPIYFKTTKQELRKHLRILLNNKI
ncbi:MAG: DEAD/DEAH box helicase family protein [Sulfurovum sp.]|nr:DEAD/DEAH box helicase family protein [Sulfurovum sp.]